jgi:hypothetical protein
MRDTIADLVCLSRSFGTYCWFITQNLATAVQDTRLLKILHTNARWSLSLRGEPSDCAFLKPFLPVTGRRLRPASNPFDVRSHYSIAEEKALVLDEIANLPDRTGWLLLKGQSPEAILIRTRSLDIPQGQELEQATLPIRRDTSIGMRLSRKEYARLAAERDRKGTAGEEADDVGKGLEQAYRRSRGEGM